MRVKKVTKILCLGTINFYSLRLFYGKKIVLYITLYCGKESRQCNNNIARRWKRAKLWKNKCYAIFKGKMKKSNFLLPFKMNHFSGSRFP